MENQKEIFQKIEEWTKQIEQNPNDTDALLERGRIYFSIKRYEEALQDQDAVIRITPDRGCAYHDKAIVYCHIERFDEAMLNFNKGLELNPEVSDIYCNRGVLYLTMNKLEEALSDLTRAIELDSDYADAYKNRGLCYFLRHNLEEALNNLNRAIELDPENADAYNNRGKIYAYMENYDKAEENYTKAIKLDPNFYDFYFSRGVMFGKLHLYNKAISDYSKAIELNPTLIKAYNNRGVIYGTVGEFELKYIDFNKCLYLSLTYIESEFLNYIYMRDVIGFYEAYPQTIKFIVDTFEIDYLDYTPVQRAMNEINDFSLLLKYYKLINVDQRAYQGIEALLYFHLGGSVSSFITLEKLRESEVRLTSQELYYYTLTMLDMNQEAPDDIEDCILELANRKLKSEIDQYYLGQLYLLKESVEEAINCFKQSVDFPFSLIMLAYITMGEYDIYMDKLESVDFQNIGEYDTNIDYTQGNLSQFQNYFHFWECTEAINFLDDYISDRIEVNQLTMWQTFSLDSQKVLVDRIKKLQAEKIFEAMRNEFGELIEKSVPENKDDILSDLKRQLVESEKRVTDIYDFMEKAVGEGRDSENQLAMVIRDWSFNNPKLYLYLIQYHYLLGNIDSKEVFSLFLYLLYTTKKKEPKLSVDNFFIGIGKDLSQYIGMKVFLSISIFQILFDLVKQITDPFEDFELGAKNDFELFNDRLWETVSDDLNTLNDKDIKVKYGLFEWFDNYYTLV